MNVGDLAIYEGDRWITIRVNSETRMALLINQAGRRVEVPDTIEEDTPDALEVVANPAANWPLVAFPTKRGTGPILSISMPGPVQSTDLATWADWVPADPVREGGALYFNPELRLRPGEVLLATFKNGSKGRITIPRSFGTVQQRIVASQTAPAKMLPPEERTRFNRGDVLGDD
jgi:hypothetical protein